MDEYLKRTFLDTLWLIVLAFVFLLTLPSCTGIRYITEDLQGKTVIVIRSGFGVNFSLGALTDSGSPLSIEAGKIATVYVSAKDGDKIPPEVANIISATRGEFSVTATGIKEGSK